MLAFESHTTLALAWLQQAHEAAQGKGFAAYYQKRPLLPGKWAAPYPETSGYLIETLIDYYQLNKEPKLLEMALKSADWIVGLQLESGALPGGLGEGTEASVFNTGQMVFGLVKAYEQSSNTDYLDGVKKACNWLLSILEEDGSWQQAAYVPGYIPSYYTRVIWAMLVANKHLNNPNIDEKMEKALNYYQKRQNKQSAFENWGFKPNEPAYTHTIAYTLRGLLESALLLNDEFAINQALIAGDKLLDLLAEKGQLAGSYDQDWNGDYSFQCLTGNAQLSIFFCRLHRFIGKKAFKPAAFQVFEPVIEHQNNTSNDNLRGGIPGSAPFNKGYQPYRYLNWAVKFYLDAYLKLNTI